MLVELAGGGCGVPSLNTRERCRRGGVRAGKEQGRGSRMEVAAAMMSSSQEGWGGREGDKRGEGEEEGRGGGGRGSDGKGEGKEGRFVGGGRET